VCRTSELRPGERRIIDAGGLSIGVFNIKGSYYALYNRCPHRAAPLCQGRIANGVRGVRRGEYEIVREGEILRCPWHGWEFDITNGRSWFNPHTLRVKSYPVVVEPGSRLPDRVASFPVSVEDDYVVVRLTSRARHDAVGEVR
jgi:3-phenylpropionate/trans-cinnamate dioxygenase ferredoxin subunit